MRLGVGSQTLLLRSPEDIATLAEKLPEFIRKMMGEEWAVEHEYRLQPLTDIHLLGRQYGLPRTASDIELLYLIGGIASLILLVACANFVNLSTANASRRQREIGIRKAAGAHRTDLFGQFILETLMTSLTAVVIGLEFAFAFLPLFRSHSGQDLPEGIALLEGVLPFVPLVWMGVAFLAGLYPAAVLSSFEPVQALKSSSNTQTGIGLFRKVLILGQFVTCILLIVCTIVMHQQTAYLKNKQLGFDQERVVTMPIFVLDQANKPVATDHLTHRYAGVKAAFENHSGVVGTSAYRWTPGVLGGILRNVRADGESLQMRILEVDEDYIDLFDIPLVAGRNFNPASLHAEEGEFLINESAAKALGWCDPVGKSFDWNDWGPIRHGRVVKDFHQRRLSVSMRLSRFWPRSGSASCRDGQHYLLMNRTIFIFGIRETLYRKAFQNRTMFMIKVPSRALFG